MVHIEEKLSLMHDLLKNLPPLSKLDELLAKTSVDMSPDTLSGEEKMNLVTYSQLKGLLRMQHWVQAEKLENDLIQIFQNIQTHRNNIQTIDLRLDELLSSATIENVDISERENDRLSNGNEHEPTDPDASVSDGDNIPRFENIHISNTMTCSQSLSLLKKKVMIGDQVFFMRSTIREPWCFGKIKRIFFKNKNVVIRIVVIESNGSKNMEKFFDKTKWQVARMQDHKDAFRSSKRVIAGPNLYALKSGIVAEAGAEHNKNRYLVFFDDGSADYFEPGNLLPIIGQSEFPWKDGVKYPERSIVQAPLHDTLKVWRGNKRLNCTIVEIDCDIFVVQYEDGNREKIYRGNPRLFTETNQINRSLYFNRDIAFLHKDILLTIERYNKAGRLALDDFDNIKEACDEKFSLKKSQVAKKSSTIKDTNKSNISLDSGSKLDDLGKLATPITQEEQEKSQHICGPECLKIDGVRTELDVHDLDTEFRNFSDLNVPLELGWRRFLAVQTNNKKGKTGRNQTFFIVYETPCKRLINNLGVISTYLRRVNSKMDISYFSMERELSLYRSREYGPVKGTYVIDDIAIDEVTKKPIERKPVSLANSIDQETLPQDFTYKNETNPVGEALKKGFSSNWEFKSRCECTDDCYARQECECHELTEEASGHPGTTKTSQSQYKNKRLMKAVTTGIFECNAFCNCSYKCPNRVVQNGMSFRLQIVKTKDRGWGVKSLDDIPKGAFICTYSADLLDDADLYGHSDTYYADLDFVTVNETAKELEDEDDEHKDEGLGSGEENSDTEGNSSGGSEEDRDAASSKNTHKRTHKMTNNTLKKTMIRDSSNDSLVSENIPSTSSRYPRRNLQKPAEPNGRANQKFKKIHDILDSHDFTLDAKQNGNVGRFLNHSCDPNSFSQNVFIDTHDLRFPTVAFFANKNIKAMDEITWNYNYKLGSIPGRVIVCRCGAGRCLGRIL